jgi:predicted enzyme related to lactoylglutathione lyase
MEFVSHALARAPLPGSTGGTKFHNTAAARFVPGSRRFPTEAMPGRYGTQAPPRNLARMITAVHTLVYADDAEAARAFFRDVLEWPHVDAHGGWLIFKTGPSELGVHPTSGDHGGQAWSTPQHHEISLMCDDLAATVAELKDKGARFAGEIRDAGFGVTATLLVPGAGEMILYQPKHPAAYDI